MNWKQFSARNRNNDTSNSPYCIVRTIFKFLIGSGLASTSSSSITTDDTLLESSADAAFIVFSTFPWSAEKKRRRNRNKRRKRRNLKQNDNQKVNILNYIRFSLLPFSSRLTTHFDVSSMRRQPERRVREEFFNIENFSQEHKKTSKSELSCASWKLKTENSKCCRALFCSGAPTIRVHHTMEFKLKNSIDIPRQKLVNFRAPLRAVREGEE